MHLHYTNVGIRFILQMLEIHNLYCSIGSYNQPSDNIQIVYLIRKDKPQLPDEHKRIENSGGAVFIPPSPLLSQLSSSVVISISSLEQLSLAISRSTGDNTDKNVDIISESIVDVFNVH